MKTFLTTRNHCFLSPNIKAYQILGVIFFVLFTCSCSKFSFVPNGTVIDGNSQYYLNDDIKLSIYVPGDFAIYNKKIKKGVKLDKLYPEDKKVLKWLHLKTSETNLLFSADPIIDPYYHFIALISDSSGVSLADYKSKYKNGSVLYYYRYLNVGKWEIAISLIPYGKSYLQFIHYNIISNNCQYCDMDELSNKNSLRILEHTELNFAALVDEYKDTTAVKPQLFNIPSTKILKNKDGIVMAYKIDPDRNSRELECFKFLKPNTAYFQLNISKGEYLIRYSDLNHKSIWEEKYTIK